MDCPDILSSHFFGLGQYSDTEWDMVPRWWQWGLDFGKERLTDGRGCFDGGYPHWMLDISIEWGKYRILPPLRLTFRRWSEDGECTYEFVFPPYEWEIRLPSSSRRLMKRREISRCEWWDWKARKS